MNIFYIRPARLPRAAVFCTALVDSNPRRYQAWIDYYTAFFLGEAVDIFLYNDGPATEDLDLKRARMITFEKPLGRQSTWVFPGWKRSFSKAVEQLGARYTYLAHIESDLIILETGRAEFLKRLRSAGYRTGYTRRHGFIETGLQILNSKRCRQFFAQRYSDPAALSKEEHFEEIVQFALRPKMLLNGERIEGALDLSQRYTYLAQMPIHRFFEKYPAGHIPWTHPAAKKTFGQNFKEARRRLRWTFKYLRQTRRIH